MAFATEEKLYTTPDAAKYLGLRDDSVRKLVQRDLLHPYQKVGQAYLFTQGELDRYREEKNPPGNPNFSRK